MMRRVIVPLFLLLLSSHAGAAAIPEVVRACVEKNLPETTSVQAIELRARDRSGYEQVLQANVYWKRYPEERNRLLMHFSEPVDIRGARFLVIGNEPQNDMYIYMPGLFKVRKITSKHISSSILGTDFSYEDYERMHSMLTDLKAEQFPDDVLDGRPVYVINSYPDDTSGYEKIASYIDIETCVTLKTELFERNHQLRKTLEINPGDIQAVGNIRVPKQLVMRDLRDKTETRMLIHDIRTGVELDDGLFDPEQLKQQEVPPITAK